jgi:pectinesterase
MRRNLVISSVSAILALLAPLPTSGYTKNLHTNTPARKIIVAADGSGQYTTVQAAVDTVKPNNTIPTTIFIRPGTYKERIVVPQGKRYVRFEGQDAEKTVLTFDLHANIPDPNGKPIGTFRTPTVFIEAENFSAKNITFANTAGPKGQALAIAVLADRAAFYNCRFLGWQDTLLAQTGRQYYKDCYIEGRTDFIFGGATAFFDCCHIHCVDGGSYITAASTPADSPWGFVFANCRITGKFSGKKTYLGRPWRDYAAVTFVNTWMCDGIHPQGWHNWDKPAREKTSRYYEYNSTGPGADPSSRVPWAHTLTDKEADAITLECVLGGQDDWNPQTN